MTGEYAKVYQPDGTFLGLLENAKLQYTLKDVPLHEAKFTLPVDDPKNELCRMGNEIEMFDNGTRIELFRIRSAPDAVYRTGGTITYNCEHVLATLMDNAIFGYLEIGGDGVTLADCMDTLLARQSVTRWVRGTCDFAALEHKYSVENKNLLQCILALAKPITGEHQWTYDTTVRPHQLHLIAPETATTCEMRYKRNMTEIRKSTDMEKLITRLYLLGYGEGVNQLTIRDVNGGVPYLDADTIGTWGVHESIHQDGTIESAATLRSIGEGLLEEHKNPYISYKVKAVDLYPLTGEPFDRYYPGKMARVNDQEYGILVTARVTEISKKDVRGKPGEIYVTIANRSRSASELIASLANRLSVGELNAQGNTVIYQVRYADNADKDHPASLPVEIPAECHRINKLRLRYKLSAFRSYSKGAAAGGGSTQTSTTGGGSVVTSSSGGYYAYSNNAWSSSPRATVGGGSMAYTGYGGNLATSSVAPDVIGVSGSADGSVGTHLHLSGTYYAQSHSHTGGSHQHYMDHYHSIEVAFNVPGHTHTTSVPSHYHDITIPSHTHDNEPGIYEGQTVASIVITVDGNTVPAGAITNNTVDLIPYLSKDSKGKILRDTEHTVLITPQAETGNTKGNTRIEAYAVVMTFVRSQGGGDY